MATVVFLVCGGEVLATRVLRRKCGVQDSMKIHPERPRQPLPGFKFTERINLRMMSRAFGMRDIQAAMALLDPRMKCDDIYSIHIVWHILHDSAGKGNVSDDRIRDQVEVLNSKF